MSLIEPLQPTGKQPVMQNVGQVTSSHFLIQNKIGAVISVLLKEMQSIVFYLR